MPQLPFDIPKSLASYAEHFDEDPLKATTRLKKQLKKRGPDAVGHFLLAWFYHLKGMEKDAVEEALKARIYAPGSPFFKKLHYYLSHPKVLEAWTPKNEIPPARKTSMVQQPGPVLNLDTLIDRLSSLESERIRPKENFKPKTDLQEDTAPDEVDDIVTETLANIHEQQGKTEAAIQTYRRLKELNKERRNHYAEQIKRLNAVKEEQEKENKNEENPFDF